jgi:hypothetical protein
MIAAESRTNSPLEPPLASTRYGLLSLSACCCRGKRGFSCEMPRCGRSQLRRRDQLQSMDRSLYPPLLQNRACHFYGTRLLSDAPFVIRHPPLLHTAVGTCDLTVHASPLRDIAPSRQGAGSSASAALLRPITCTSPSARQPIRGVTPGLCFLRDPSRHAMRLAPAHDHA